MKVRPAFVIAAILSLVSCDLVYDCVIDANGIEWCCATVDGVTRCL